ncbi:MAG: hypothetical protein WCK98_04525 [bacterium]
MTNTQPNANKALYIRALAVTAILVLVLAVAVTFYYRNNQSKAKDTVKTAIESIDKNQQNISEDDFDTSGLSDDSLGLNTSSSSSSVQTNRQQADSTLSQIDQALGLDPTNDFSDQGLAEAALTN